MSSLIKQLIVLSFTFTLLSCALITKFDIPKFEDAQDADDVDQVDVDVDVEGEDIPAEEVPPTCGDGTVDTGEECDDGANGDPDDGCTDECTYSCHDNTECGDLDMCNGNEECNLTSHTCEDGIPLVDGYVCGSAPRSICLAAECVESQCGDGYVDSGAGESCEPPNEGNCGANCNIICTGDPDCPDDDNPCNGEEFCDTDAGECSHRNAPADGTECGTSPRMICLAATCQESLCGDSFPDEGGGEECDDGADGDDTDGCTDTCEFTCEAATQDTDCDDAHDCTENICDPDTHTCSNPAMADTVECRASAGACDVAENCDGTNADCPADAVLDAGTECRASTGLCDAAEVCDGVIGTCPVDSLAPAGTPCDDADDCSMLDICDGSGGCSGTENCDNSPIIGTGTDTRIGICITDASCDTAVGGPGCRDTEPPHFKSSWTDWDPATSSPMAYCDTYYAYTSPPLTSGTEHCWAFYHSRPAALFYADQSAPAVCGPGHCGQDACGYTP